MVPEDDGLNPVHIQRKIHHKHKAVLSSMLMIIIKIHSLTSVRIAPKDAVPVPALSLPRSLPSLEVAQSSGWFGVKT